VGNVSGEALAKTDAHADDQQYKEIIRNPNSKTREKSDVQRA
jgi:hypothetical protein